MNTISTFLVVQVLQTSARSVVICERQDDIEFNFDSGMMLGGISVKDMGMPRILDEDGNPRLNCLAFSLTKEEDSIYFKKGALVELAYNNETNI